MTCYLRFFHLQTSRFSFLQIETLVTITVLMFFVALPSRFLAFRFHRSFRRFAQNRARACVVIFLLSCLGRVALLVVEPFPAPNVHDEFSYLLAGDTFAHGRLTNPTPPLWHHFEAFYVLLTPTYASKYGAALPVFMAAGQRFTGTPRTGVVVSMALAAASLCWMLQAYVPAEWAFLGGLLAVVRISWFSYFGNAYWGGSIAILGGCLLLGAAIRLTRKPAAQDGLLLALGLLLLLNCRPFEGALVALPGCLYTLRTLIVRHAKPHAWLPGLALLLAGTAGTAYYFHRVTGAFEFPWVVYWRQWSMVPPFFFGKVNQVQYQFRDQVLYNSYYEMLPYVNLRARGGWLIELAVKSIYQWLFFVFPALTLTLIGFVPTLRAKRYRLLVFTLAFSTCGFVTETWLQAHYVAVVSGIIYLIIVNGLRWMRAVARARHHEVWLRLMRGTMAAVIIMTLVRLVVVPGDTFPPNWASQTGDIPGYEDMHQLMETKPGKQLVIVRYRPDHASGYSWINNGYDISSQHVIWARDTEPEESNLPLLCAFSDRRAWLLVPPETGFIPPPDRTAPWNSATVKQFVRPYPVPAASVCSAISPGSGRLVGGRLTEPATSARSE